MPVTLWPCPNISRLSSRTSHTRMLLSSSGAATAPATGLCRSFHVAIYGNENHSVGRSCIFSTTRRYVRVTSL
ncbi:hypothetical protein BV22DRAFT_848009 [Leucogyrophana mollusca]|uniref:Uncharacterized protein n=1 Tax=Leucogyrophana mollusca TaxID=85980 RepID=A0ACB8B3A9_9AGAM|nr:hypothetical protein BV22DRAFT_848009 [Leucogyrophana mollusca]